MNAVKTQSKLDSNILDFTNSQTNHKKNEEDNLN
jgi:hypothetical protein